jgi:acyl-CoA synthetase
MNRMLTLQEFERGSEFYKRNYWRADTLYSLLRASAEKTPDRFALRDTNTRLTFRDALEWVDAVAQDLHEAGLRQGDRVSIWLPSRIESALLLLACSRMGYACNTSLHRDYTCREVVALLDRAGSSAFFMQPGYGADAGQNDLSSMLGSLRRLKKVYRLDPLQPKPSEADVAQRFGGVSRGTGRELPASANPNLITYLAFTSGTTGQPKGVMHSDNTILAMARAMVKDWSFDQQTTVYSFSPMSHNIGTVGLAVAIACGGEFVVHTPFDATRAFDRVVETGATFLLGVPTHAIDLLTEVERRGMTKLGRVSAFEVGGSPVPPTLVHGLLKLGITTQNAFGMTENHSFQYTRPDDPPDIIANTCGRPCEGMEIKLWDENNPDSEVAQGEIGELGVRGASLMLGYFDDQATTELSFNRRTFGGEGLPRRHFAQSATHRPYGAAQTPRRSGFVEIRYAGIFP